ncbi:hypothetical protein CAE01nite_20340 [Cellulomonas aerilata]|uniref:Uncharacterized protein n=1 Tax=Cellulomonas aerilata TaxID=515326 RepID=A0A512DCV8_9CELL|nr:hypothetical protein CAE01nite_20340 [Cellulomonas aerilata]
MLPVSTVWFVDVADRSSGTALKEQARQALDRVRETLADIADSGIGPASGRPRPLVALPTLGVGGGGFDQVRGFVVDGLIRVCEEAVEAAEIDVVIVAATASDYAAFQQHRRVISEHPVHIGVDGLEQARTLATKVRDGSIALFLGAGVSMSAGLPSWGGLIEELAGTHATDVLSLASPLDQAELLQERLGNLQAQVADLISEKRRYGLNHALLAALGCREAVTTNYDHLYERAMADAGQRVVPVLPFENPAPEAPWLLKMHGDVAHPHSIVLTRSDFVGYHARSGPLGAVVQALLLTKHLLVVGASMTDDNFLRLAHEVLAFRAANRGENGESSPLGTVLTLDPQPVKAELWRNRFDYVAASVPSADDGVLARRLAIFLDSIAMHAAEPRHLADPRYDYLLDDDGRAIAEAARELAKVIDARAAGGWEALRRTLEQHGLTAPRFGKPPQDVSG